MLKKIVPIFSCAAALMLLASSAQAQFVLIDDFQGYTAGDVLVDLTTPRVGPGATWTGDPNQVNQHTVQVDPDCAANLAMQQSGAPGNAVTRAEFNSAATNIAAGATGTLFYRFRVPVGTAGTTDHVVGLTDNNAITNFDFKSGLRNVANNRFDLRDGVTPGYEEVVQTLADDTWYNFWMVSTNTNPGTFRAYLQSDSDPNFATQTELIGDDAWDYRINGATDIINVYFRGANNGGGVAGNDLYIDDIYINPSAADLSNPAVAVPCDGMVLKGDVNLDGSVTFLDIAPFIAVLSSNGFQAEADCDCGGTVTFLDINPFIQILSSGP